MQGNSLIEEFHGISLHINKKGDQKELLSMEELCENFTLERVGKSGAKFDFDKTRWFNQQYLRKKSSKELVKELQIILKTKEIEAEDAFVEEIKHLLSYMEIEILVMIRR